MLNLCTRRLDFCWCEYFYNENPKIYWAWAILVKKLQNGTETIIVLILMPEYIIFMIFAKILLISEKLKILIILMDFEETVKPS